MKKIALKDTRLGEHDAYCGECGRPLVIKKYTPIYNTDTGEVSQYIYEAFCPRWLCWPGVHYRYSTIAPDDLPLDRPIKDNP